MSAEIKIQYCVKCGWLLRAGWLAQELLSTFGGRITALTLVPSSGGVFNVFAAGELVWSRQRDGGFPSAAELKRVVRDKIAPEMTLGHADG